ncbi:putative phage tail protein [Paenibacillus sp. L3-i20]|uniref:putative phage tail protein n=1 Tax=Paenibacillus sp. L3-i20 TaxID=2905833 RepID=UPI001EE05F44|nr:putative phage tail protein [Paenibacillus sp. L3-i20]GKU75650.1 hypothetical protein L3i20_v200470 [Paenibacillus sp. L3-i20]
MSVKLIEEYLPNFYGGIREFIELLSAEDVEFEWLSTSVQQILDDQFIETSSEQAVKRREIMYKIRSDPSIESLETRRSRLLARTRSRIPFSAETLELIAEAYTHRPVKVSVDSYSIVFDFDSAFIEDPSFLEQVEKIIPAHMLLNQRGYWEYPSNIDVVGQYTVQNYPFQAFASQTTYCGTLYNGPMVVTIPPNPVYDNGGIETISSYETKHQAPYAISGLVYAGTSGVAIPHIKSR